MDKVREDVNNQMTENTAEFTKYLCGRTGRQEEKGKDYYFV